MTRRRLPANISTLVAGLAHNGRLIIVAGANDMMEISPLLLLMGQRSVGGWTGGSIEETNRFSILFKIIPMIEVFPLEQAPQAFERMMSSKVHFRAVLKPGA